MVTLDRALETETDVKTYRVNFYSNLYGYIETRDYSNLRIAKSNAAKTLQNEMHYDHFEILDPEGYFVDSGTFGFDVSWAMTRLRAFRNCCRSVIGGWEIEAECFRLMVDKGYIVPAENHLDHEAGYWFITDRFRKVGNYLVKRKWGRA